MVSTIGWETEGREGGGGGGGGEGEGGGGGKVVVVVSPLISLMEDQVMKVKEAGMKGCFLGTAQIDGGVTRDAWMVCCLLFVVCCLLFVVCFVVGFCFFLFDFFFSFSYFFNLPFLPFHSHRENISLSI